ncbi:hypothetical protein BGZ83_005208 [Gryganskiella cystojenkinii]|nr:hypothetical protein BGZ83_005208 [Gryganskiella cystojenkinii]
MSTMVEHAPERHLRPTSIVALTNGQDGDVLSTGLPLTKPNQGFHNTVIGELKVLKNQGTALLDQGAMTQQFAREVLELQKQMNDRLILIQSKTEAILTQQLELAEYPIPRLFVVLPEEPMKTKFRLYFICECGKHTEPSDGNGTPHHLHLAKHEGYIVREPTEFFKKYCPFLLLMLEMIKTGINVAGCVVPVLASMKVTELVSSAQEGVKTVIDIKTVTDIKNVTSQINISLKCIDKHLANGQQLSSEDSNDRGRQAAMTQQDLTNYLNGIEGLEGVELRQLESFLETSKDGNYLGNLYRMTTSDGYVKWVCLDHYRVSYQEKHTQKLRDVVNLVGGRFGEQLGKVTVTLSSSSAASEFCRAINKARGVHELIVDLRWMCTRNHIDELYGALKISRVSILRLDLGQFGTNLSRTSLGRTSLSKLVPKFAHYGVLSRIIGLHSMRMIHIVLPKDFTMLSSFHPKRPSHLSKLSFELVAGSLGGMELVQLASSLKTSSILATLHLGRNFIGFDGAQALSEALKINLALTGLHLDDNSIRDNGVQALADALKANSTLTTLSLGGNSIREIGAQALGEALKVNSALYNLDLRRNSIGDNGVKSLSEALKTNSTLTTLSLLTFSKALKVNSVLTTLNLLGNSTHSSEARVLFEALKTRSTLITDLSGDFVRYSQLPVLGHLGPLRPASVQAWPSASVHATEIYRPAPVPLPFQPVPFQPVPFQPEPFDSVKGWPSAPRPAAAPLVIETYRPAPVPVPVPVEPVIVRPDTPQVCSSGKSGADVGALALWRHLTPTPTLDLRSNSIRDYANQALAEALKTNNSQTTLNFQNLSIRGNGAPQVLAEALKTNSTLTTLNLYNSIGDHGAQVLAEALKTNSTLTTLNLYNSPSRGGFVGTQNQYLYEPM